MSHLSADPQDFLYEKLENYFLGPMGWTIDQLDTYVQSIQHLGPHEEFTILIKMILNQWIGDISQLYSVPTAGYLESALSPLIQRGDLKIRTEISLAALGVGLPSFLTSLLDISDCSLHISGDGCNIFFGMDILASNFFRSSFFDPIKSLPDFNKNFGYLTSKIIGPNPELVFRVDPVINPNMGRLQNFLYELLRTFSGITIFFAYHQDLTAIQTIAEYEQYVRTLTDKMTYLWLNH